MESSDNSFKTKVLIFILLLFIELLIGSILLTRNYILDEINQEIKMTANFLGESAADAYQESANKTFKYLFVDTSLVEHSYKLWIPDKTVNQYGLEGMGQRGFDEAESKINNMWDIVFKGVLRCTLFFSWVPFFLPLFIPAIINGLMERQVKKLNYGYASPVRFTAAYSFILSSGVIIPVYLIFPIAINPIVIPIWLALCTLSFLVMFSNLQKMI